MKRAPAWFLVVTAVALVVGTALTAGGCAGCGAPAEGEGEGEGLPDAGAPDPEAVGLDARPSNTSCFAPARPVLGGDIALEEPWPSLTIDAPLFLLEEPGTDRIYVIERFGRIVRFDKSDSAVTDPEVFGDINERVLSSNGNGESGLLGMAFHPEWPAVPEVFLSYNGVGDNEDIADIVSRFALDADGTLDEASEEVLIFIDDFAGNHNGGMIAFGRDGYLYYGTGDGGFANDPRGNGQDPASQLSKMLRIDVDSAPDPGLAYAIPADNPFIADDTYDPAIWAEGFRNPWRFSFDRDSGDLWLGDVGQGQLEEIDLVQAGGNYGWSAYEGTDCFNGPCEVVGLVDPVIEYRHRNARVAVVGGYVYRGTQVAALVGSYVYAEFGTGEIFTLPLDGTPPVLDADGEPVALFDHFGNVSSFSEDEDGELYVIDHNGNSIFRVIAAGAPPIDNFPTLLSATGCVDPANPTLPSTSMIPFTVNHELWSDGATKERYLALPDGTTANILDDGDIEFPIGTVLTKSFRVDDELIETRLLVRHDDGDWGGYSYEWNDDATDATLVSPAGKTKVVRNGQTWVYPSRNGCVACHTLAAGRALGPELAQWNGPFIYPGDRLALQLTTLDAIGLFSSPLPEELPVYPSVTDAFASDEAKARAYLHTNCAICHRPGGIGAGQSDMRFATSLGAANLCNVVPQEGPLGLDTDPRLIAPGDPARSMISIRMKRLGQGRMPLIGSLVVDDVGIGVVDAWVASVAECP